jgi:transposase InsO family protein
MALRTVTMAELRLEVLLEAEQSGESVAEVCRRYRISRETYYRYRRRYLAAGMEGLEDRSRRPRVSPAQIDAALEAEICGMRRAHPRWGARRIHAELVRAGRSAPAVSTIHQALRRNHLVAAQPPRKPKALLRFERDVANDLWQIDATEVRLADQHKAYVLDVIDDHSRYLLAAIAADAPTGKAAWDCFEDAASRYGLPRQVLSDNGLCFTGRLHGVTVEFERALAELDVELINAAAYHPRPSASSSGSIAPSRNGSTTRAPPVTSRTSKNSSTACVSTTTGSDPTRPSATAPPVSATAPQVPMANGRTMSVGFDQHGEPIYPPKATVRAVSEAGKLTFANKQIQVGRRWAGTRVRVVTANGLVHLYWGEEHIRSFAIGQPLPTRHQNNPRSSCQITLKHAVSTISPVHTRIMLSGARQ